MSWESISKLRSARNDPVKDRMAVQVSAVVIRLGEATLASAKWQAGDPIDIQIGKDGHSGMIRLVKSPRGWRLTRPGGRTREKGLILKFGKKMARGTFHALPEHMSSTIIHVAVDGDGAVLFRLPWIAPAVAAPAPPPTVAGVPLRVVRK